MKNLLIYALMALCVFLYFRSSRKSDQADTVIAKEKVRTKAITSEAKILSNSIDPTTGVIHARIMARAAENVVKAAEASYVPVLDSAAQKLEIQAKQIEYLTTVNSQLKAENLQAKKGLDNTYRFKDKYVTLAFTKGTEVDSLNQGRFDFAYDSDLSLVQYKKRNWFLGEKKSYIDISSTDNRVTFKGIQRMTVEQKIPNFGMQLQAMSTTNIANGKTFIGPAARMQLGRFSLGVGHLYNLNQDAKVKTKNMISGTYDIFRF